MRRRDFLKAGLAAGLLAAVPSPLPADSGKADARGPSGGPHDADGPAGAGGFAKYAFVDSHLHYLDFIQGTDGLEALTKAMDQAGVGQAVLFGMPMVKQWSPSSPNKPAYYLSNDARCYYYSATDYILLKALDKAPKSVRSRFLPFICGINANDMNAASQLRRLLEEFPGRIAGIGEIMSRHDDLTALTCGEPPRADHPALLMVCDLAAETGLPLLIHHNIAGSYMKEPIYLAEMERALRHNRQANIIWAHVGVSRRVEVPNLAEIADKALRGHPNLYFDISWLVFENYIARDETSLDLWAGLMERHAERFMIGSDVVGHWAGYPPNITKYRTLLDRLSPQAAAAVARGNILRLVKAGQPA